MIAPVPDRRRIDDIIDAAIVAGYQACPQDDEEEAVARAALQVLLDEEPW